MYCRKPWIVKVRGVYVGEYDTKEEAREARNTVMATNAALSGGDRERQPETNQP